MNAARQGAIARRPTSLLPESCLRLFSKTGPSWQWPAACYILLFSRAVLTSPQSGATMWLFSESSPPIPRAGPLHLRCELFPHRYGGASAADVVVLTNPPVHCAALRVSWGRSLGIRGASSWQPQT